MPQKISIESINAELSRVRVIVRGKKLYLRATMPTKGGLGVKQQDISTQLNNDPNGLRIVKLRAQRLESDLNLEKFQWSDWIDILPEGQIMTGEAVQRYEIFFWETRKRTPSREADFINIYQRYLKKLPEKEPLTGELLRKYLVKYEVDSYYRDKCYMVFSSFAKWADVPLPKDWKYLKGNYQVKRDRIIPSTDLEVEEARERVKNPNWQWILGILAIYGLRPHELFHFDFIYDEDIDNLIVSVGESTKTKSRVVYPLFPIGSDWVREWGYLVDAVSEENKKKAKKIEAIQTKRGTEFIVYRFPRFTIDGHTNKELGAKISKYLSSERVGFEPYAFRDRYAVRGIELPHIDSIVVARWMGHSLEVHEKDYAVYLNRATMVNIWRKSRGL
jgi:integrase